LDQAISWTKAALLDGKLQVLLSPPKVELEDVKDILKRSIIVPKGLEPLKATFSYVYQAGERGKTLLIGTILLQDREIKSLEVKGEILKNRKLYESFNLRYYFEELNPPYPASFQISLFPGTYEIKILAQESSGKKGFNLFEKIEVPSMDAVNLKESRENIFEITIPFQETPQKGITQFQVNVPPRVKSVKFFLDNIFVAQKNKYPFSIEIDLGNLPLPHTIEAIGYDSEEKEVGRDVIFINQGIDSFKIKILSPRGNLIYYKNVFFKAEILKPEGKKVEKVELWEGENLVMEYLTPPYEGIISIPYKPQPLLRAVAYLEDGRKTEDTVLLNSSLFEEKLKVNFVNLYVSATTSSGKPVKGLKKEDFEIFEDNIKQEIVDFKEAGNLPLNLSILLDTSASMEPYFENIKKAILFFSENYLKEGDKISIISFNSTQKVLLPLTSERKNISPYLENLKAEGTTNLYDAIVFSLYQFQNRRERNALLLLTDGKDTGSSFKFEDCLDYIKHSQVIVYPLAINIKFTDLKIRKVLSDIAEVSGGTFFPITSEEIDYTYKRISEELRAQYLISYISSQTGEGFRKVQVKIKENLIAKTISGYFP
ncbi:MAG: VWA domain-containing protein, partial [Thermoanaerobaculia bacterium]